MGTRGLEPEVEAGCIGGDDGDMDDDGEVDDEEEEVMGAVSIGVGRTGVTGESSSRIC